jgi:CheY-like chemotaxis protein/CRP-like cAMP-binding protein
LSTIDHLSQGSARSLYEPEGSLAIKSKIVIEKKTRNATSTESVELQPHEVALSQESLDGAGAFEPSLILTDPSSGTTSREFKADEFIFLQGDAADAVFYVQSGKVKLTVVSQSGKEVVVASLPESSFFGEGCLAGQPLCLSSASAVQQSTIIRVTKQAMATLIHQKPKFAERFLAYLLSRNVRIESDWVDVLASGDNTVLCIDDEPNGLVVRKAILRNKGYEVLTALSGPEGLKLFEANPVDAVVLDYSMPGMHGGQVAAELKRLNPDIKILLLSSYVDIPKETLQCVDKHSVKGVSPTSFVTDLEQLLSC